MMMMMMMVIHIVHLNGPSVLLLTHFHFYWTSFYPFWPSRHHIRPPSGRVWYNGCNQKGILGWRSCRQLRCTLCQWGMQLVACSWVDHRFFQPDLRSVFRRCLSWWGSLPLMVGHPRVECERELYCVVIYCSASLPCQPGVCSVYYEVEQLSDFDFDSDSNLDLVFNNFVIFRCVLLFCSSFFSLVK